MQEIQQLLRYYHIKPNYRRGQNFLIDDEVYEAIIKTAKLSKQDTVLEIGAGLGTLTERLAANAGRVMAVELDKKLTAILEHRLKGYKNINVINADILAHPVSKFNISSPYKVVANIPYNITSAILKKFLTQDISPTSLTLMVQKEVGERIQAGMGEMSLLALSVQLYSEPKIIQIVSRESFLPPPEVDSVILQISDVHPFPFADVSEKFFWRVARVGFAARRKQLKNNLVNGLGLAAEKILKILSKARIEDKARAQDLSIEQWHSLVYNLEREKINK